MPTRPDPPDSLSQYLAEGVPKQSDEDLRVFRDWIDDLLAYLDFLPPLKGWDSSA